MEEQAIVLPLNKKPDVRCYSDYSTMLGICMNSYCVGKLAAEIEVTDAVKEYREIQTDMSTEWENNRLKLYVEPYSKHRMTQLERKLANEDELILQINHQQYSCAASCVGIFVEKKQETQDGQSHELLHYSKMSLNNWNQIKQAENRQTAFLNRYPIWLKAKVENGCLQYFISYDGSEYEVVDEIYLEQQEYVIGIRADFQRNQFYDWLFQNFVQIASEPSSWHMHIDYQSALSKNWKKNYVNAFLNYQVKNIHLIQKSIKDYVEYFKQLLRREYYIYIELNEYYVKDRETYLKESRDHINLIYGYDDEKRCFFAAGIDLKGQMCYTEIDYDSILNAIESCSHPNESVVISYEPVDSTYEFKKENFIKTLQDYLASQGTFDDLVYIVPAEKTNLIYGIGMYQAFSEEEYTHILIDDLRVTYIIYEHKKNMLARLEFLRQREFIDQISYEKFIVEMKELVTYASKLKNYTLKCFVRKDYSKMDAIRNLLSEMESIERALYKQLIDCLCNSPC